MDRTRREFLARTGCAALGMAAFQAGLDKLGLISAYARPAAADYRALVCVFLGGGNDGNSMIVPLDATGYQAYSDARTGSGLALDSGQYLSVTPATLGTPFGFHPSMTAMPQLFTDHKLAVVANVGPLVQPLTRAQFQNGDPQPYALFSHSDQVTQWQSARADVDTRLGWGGRTGDFTAALNSGAIFPIVTSVNWGTSLFGLGLTTRPLGIAPAPTPLDEVLVLYGFYGSPGENARLTSMNHLRTIDRSATLVAATSDATQQAYDISQALSTDPSITTHFPGSDLGDQLLQVAKLIKLNQTAPTPLKRQIFYCETGGYDTHTDQIDDQADLLGELSAALKAFYDATVELGVASQVTTFTLSDFGRTLQPSGDGGSVGTDHAWGNHQLVIGGAVGGGDFYGVPGSTGSVFPTLSLGGPDDTDDRGRWIPTCAVEQYAATLASWFGVAAADIPTLFPLIGRFTTPNLGFLP
ncbi:MAG TPA: DUF1501 domain-containing protein [Thermoanaerobaculia bacterium]|jgi:uncharacterized protein (DUF1501 family)